jgi:hypothetical protein
MMQDTERERGLTLLGLTVSTGKEGNMSSTLQRRKSRVVGGGWVAGVRWEGLRPSVCLPWSAQVSAIFGQAELGVGGIGNWSQFEQDGSGQGQTWRRRGGGDWRQRTLLLFSFLLFFLFMVKSKQGLHFGCCIRVWWLAGRRTEEGAKRGQDRGRGIGTSVFRTMTYDGRGRWYLSCIGVGRSRLPRGLV